MILKIKGRKGTSSWKIFGSIDSVNYSRDAKFVIFNAGSDSYSEFFVQDTMFEVSKMAKWNLLEPYYSCVDVPSLVGKYIEIPMTVVFFDLVDGTKRACVFNTEAYLLNDEGKTIERIPDRG